MILKIKKINQEFLKRYFFKKIELKKKIIKVLFKNKNKNKNIFLSLIKSKFKKKNLISRQKNICSFKGRYKFYIKYFKSGRHYANKLAFWGKLNNASLKSW